MRVAAIIRLSCLSTAVVMSLPVPVCGDAVVTNWPAPLLWSGSAKSSKEAPEIEESAVEPMSVTAVPTNPVPFVGITPCRIADTRGDGFSGDYGPPSLTGGVPRDFALTGQCGLPANAEAVSLNITVTNPIGPGFILIYPRGGAQPNVSTLNYVAGQTIANAAVVPLGTVGSITVVAGVSGTDLIIDTNGYYGGNFDSLYVNEGQSSSITSAMITDGAIVNADINASAAIADTKLATIATAGKVADSALSANVTKLGQSIEANEITNITRTVTIPLSTLLDCESSPFAFLKFASGSDNRADFDATGPGAGGNGVGFNILFDTSPGFEDQNTEICSQLAVPQDYVSGGQFRVLTKKVADSGATEVLNCALGRNVGAMEAPGLVEIVGAVPVYVNCIPTLPAGLTAGDTLRFYLSITSSGTMNDQLRLYSVAFEYTASQ